jgi:uncharacterized membrane protein YhaH (DUF805 family)
MRDLERLVISRHVNGRRRYYMIASIIWLAAMALFAAIILIAHSDIFKPRAVARMFIFLLIPLIVLYRRSILPLGGLVKGFRHSWLPKELGT